jgi:hypothetical protein
MGGGWDLRGKDCEWAEGGKNYGNGIYGKLALIEGLVTAH